MYRVAFSAKSDTEQVACDTMDAFIENVVSSAGCDDYDLYLTGHDNFRKEVAKQKPYKGNRKQPKPDHFKCLRAHAEWLGAIVSEGEEADDLLGKHQTSNTVICTIDKDLKMIPGWHYNWNKGEVHEVSRGQADLFFWWQMMVGDSTDNIPGVPGMGEKRADQVIIDCRCEMASIQEEVYDMYHSHYVDEWQDVMQEMADLLWIRRADETRKLV